MKPVQIFLLLILWIMLNAIKASSGGTLKACGHKLNF